MDQIDARFTELAVKQKIVTSEQADECIRIVEEVARIGAPASLPDTMVHKGYISRADADAVLAQARSSGPKTTSLAGYELLAKLGQGGMGVVYKARQVSVDRIVAIKILRPHLGRDEAYLERFIREAHAAAKLNHPNVVRAIDAGSADGYHYFVMEFADGQTAAERLKSGPMGEAEALKITREMAKALAHAHSHGVVHRDVKPGNIMLLPGGTAKLADLGLAKTIRADNSVTADGKTLGTPNYMSPEQARGQADLDGRSDIYSLGSTLFHFVTGAAPFLGSTAATVISKLLTEPTPDPQVLLPTISPAVRALIHKMMAKDPAQRQQTADELLADIDAASEGQMPRPPSDGPAGEDKPAALWRRHKALTAAVAGVLALAIGIVAVNLAPQGPSVEELAQSAFDAAATYDKQNPDDPDAAIERLLAVINDYKGTDPAARAERLLQDVRRRKAGQTVMRDVGRLKENCDKLAGQDKYGDAIELIDAFAEAHDDKLAGTEAAKLRTELMAAAERRSTDLARQAAAALDKKDYAKVRAALETVAGFGLEEYAKMARDKLAQIDAMEEGARRLAEWEKIKTEAAAMRKEGRYEEAMALIEKAKGLPLPGIAGLVEERIKALREALENARIAAEAKYAAVFRADVKPLIAKRDYQGARKALENFTHRQDLKHAAAPLEQNRADLDRLAALWKAVGQRLTELRPRDVIRVNGKNVRFVSCGESMIRYKVGNAEKGIRLTDMKAGDVLSLMPAPDEEEPRLRAAAFLLYDELGDIARAYDLLADGGKHPDAIRYRAMAVNASEEGLQEEEEAAEAAFEELRKHTADALADALKNGTANPDLLEKPLDDFRARFGHTRLAGEHLADLAAAGSAFRAVKSLQAWHDSYYLLVKWNASWHDAKAQCEKLDGHLAAITTAAEQEYVVKEFMKPHDDGTRPHIWLGATNETEDGKWRWVTDDDKWAYQAWVPDQPDNATGEQHSLELCMIFKDIGWNDARGKDAKWYLCEWQKDSARISLDALRELSTIVGLPFTIRGADQYEKQLLERVTCHKQGVPLQHALVAVLNQVDVPYRWTTPDKLAAAARPVNVQADDVRIQDVLESILGPRGLAYKIDDGGLILIPRKDAAGPDEPSGKKSALSRKVRGEVVAWDPKTLRATVEYDFNTKDQLLDWAGGTIDSKGRLRVDRSAVSLAPLFTSIERITFDGYLISGRGRVTVRLCKNIVAELGGGTHVLFQSDLRNPIIRKIANDVTPDDLLRTTLEVVDGRVTWTLNRQVLGSVPLQEKPAWPAHVKLGNPFGDTRYDNVRIMGVVDKKWLEAGSGK